MATVKVTDDTFAAEVTNSEIPVVVDFWAEWCGPCRMLTPIIEKMSADYDGRAIIGKVNVDQNPGVSAKFGVRNIPTVLFIKDGEVAEKSVGAVPEAALVEKLAKLL